jgi:DNA recombination protein RmuC
MFVPSESIFADIHERFEDVVQKAMRARVVIVSPSMLMLSIQVMQGLLRDVRMREEAHTIQKEVRELLDDVGRLKDRVIALQKHFKQADNDIGDILTSTSKIVPPRPAHRRTRTRRSADRRLRRWWSSARLPAACSRLSPSISRP